MDWRTILFSACAHVSAGRHGMLHVLFHLLTIGLLNTYAHIIFPSAWITLCASWRIILVYGGCHPTNVFHMDWRLYAVAACALVSAGSFEIGSTFAPLPVPRMVQADRVCITFTGLVSFSYATNTCFTHAFVCTLHGRTQWLVSARMMSVLTTAIGSFYGNFIIFIKRYNS